MSTASAPAGISAPASVMLFERIDTIEVFAPAASVYTTGSWASCRPLSVVTVATREFHCAPPLSAGTCAPSRFVTVALEAAGTAGDACRVLTKPNRATVVFSLIACVSAARVYVPS